MTRTPLACPDPPERPLVTVYATVHRERATTVTDISGWSPQPTRTTGATADWAALDRNEGESAPT